MSGARSVAKTAVPKFAALDLQPEVPLRRHHGGATGLGSRWRRDRGHSG